MKLTYVAAVLLVAIAAIALLALMAPQQQPGDAGAGSRSLEIIDIGRAGDYGYAIVDLKGAANMTLLGYDSPPLRNVVILNDSDGMGDASAFADDLSQLERYGFTVSVSGKKALAKNTIFVVPTGAIPSYVLDDLVYNATNTMVVYVGKPDLVLRDGGVKQEAWYAALDEQQRGRVALYDTTPAEFTEQSRSLARDIIENRWAVKERSDFNLTYNGRRTYSFLMNDSQYMRLVAAAGDKVAMVDSQRMAQPPIKVDVSPQSLFPWEKANLSFTLDKTNGTASLSILKDGNEESRKELGRVREVTYFPERIGLESPGDHVVRILDNTGTIGATVIHVKDLNVSYIGPSGVSYLFNVTVDGEPVNNVEAAVHLANSSLSKDFFVSGGVLAVPAQLRQGDNVFSISLLGTVREVIVSYAQEGLADVYIKYGIPGLLIIVAVYFGVRMSRRPVYVLRVGETAGEIRKDVRLPAQAAVSLFKSARKELGIGNSPITAHEFSIALKRHVTEGADVTEGNVEEILQHLARRGFLESHRQYYQLKGEGEVKRNAMVRIIRDKLIQGGIAFRAKGGHFVTERMEIGFFGDDFSKNAVAVIEDQQELDTLCAGLGQQELAALQIKLANGALRFVTLDKLDEVL